MTKSIRRSYSISEEAHVALRVEALRSGEKIGETLERIIWSVLGPDAPKTVKPATASKAAPAAEPEPEVEEKKESRVLPPAQLAAKHGHQHEITDDGFHIVHPFGDDLWLMSPIWELYAIGDDQPLIEHHDLDRVKEEALSMKIYFGFNTDFEMKQNTVIIPYVVGREREYIWQEDVEGKF